MAEGQRPPTIADELEMLVGFLDEVDRLMGIVGRGVQADLPVIAAWFREHPEADAEVYGRLEPESPVGAVESS